MNVTDTGIAERAGYAGHDLRLDRFTERGMVTWMSCDRCDVVVEVHHLPHHGYRVDLAVVDRRCGG